MYIKFVAIETSPDGYELMTSLMFPLGHPLCQLYYQDKWNKNSSFIYDTDESNIPFILDGIKNIMNSTRRHISCGHRRIFEMWECKPKDVIIPFEIIQPFDLLELPYELNENIVKNIRTFPLHQDANSILNLKNHVIPFNLNPWSKVAQNGIVLTEFINRTEL